MAEMISEGEVLARIRGLTRGELRLCIESGWLHPAQERAGQFYFLEVDVARARLIHELRDDLALDEEALPVVLSLIDQLHAVRYRLTCLVETLAAEPDDRRNSLLTALRERLRTDLSP